MKIKIDNQEIELTTLVSILTITVVLLSYYNTVVMYGLFAINITPFLDPSEIIFSSTPFFIVILLFGANYVVLIWLIKILRHLPTTEGGRFQKLAKLRNSAISIVSMLATLLSTLALLHMIGIDSHGTEHLLLIGAFFMFESDKISWRNKIIAVVFILMCVIAERNVRYHVRITNGTPEYFIEAKTDKHHFKSDATLIYIGSTKNAIFFWDGAKNEAKAFAISNWEWVIMKRNKEFSL